MINDIKNNRTQSVSNKNDFDNLKHEIGSQIGNLEQKVNKMVNDIKTKLREFETSINSNIDNKITGNKEEIEKTVATCTANASEALKATFSETLLGEEKQNEDIVKEVGVTGMMKYIIVKQRQEQIQEELEREERQKNIIIYKAVEQEGTPFEERKKHDKQLVENILREIERPEIEVKTVVRLGRFDSNKHSEGKCRPLKVVLYNKECRDSIMRNRFKLNLSKEAEMKNIRIAYDLSPEEWNAVNEKIEEAKTKSAEQDHYFWKVRGPPWALRLVRDRKKTTQSQSNPTQPPETVQLPNTTEQPNTTLNQTEKRWITPKHTNIQINISKTWRFGILTPTP